MGGEQEEVDDAEGAGAGEGNAGGALQARGGAVDGGVPVDESADDADPRDGRLRRGGKGVS